MATKLSKGTFINLHGSHTPLRLAADAQIEEIADQTYVGSLLGDKANNWPLNIENVDGKFNPHTGAPMLNECVKCGREISDYSPNQKTCEVCISADSAGAAAATPPRRAKKAAAKKSTAKKGSKKASGEAKKTKAAGS